jgi:hypothetical protein
VLHQLTAPRDDEYDDFVGLPTTKHQWTPSPLADPEREIKCLEKSDSFDNVLSGRLEREKKEKR